MKSNLYLILKFLFTFISSISFLRNLESFSAVRGATLSFVGVQADPSTVQTSNSNLIIYGTLLNQIPASGKMVITAPSQIVLSAGSLSCSFVLPSSRTEKTCISSGGAGGTITVTLSSIFQAEAFEIHIQSAMTNPQSTTTTSSFSFATQTAASVVIDQLSSGITLTATVGSLQSLTFAPVSAVVGASTNLRVTFTPTHNVPSGSIIRVAFPKWNPSATSPADYLQGSISCSTSAPLSTSSIQCAFANSALTVTGAFGSSITGGQQLTFVVTSFVNPISTAQVSGFTLLITDSSSGSIDQGSGTVQVSTPATITSGSIVVDSSVSSSIAGIVQETNKMRLTFFSPVPLNANCVIKVTLPNQFSLSTINSVSIGQLFGQQQVASITKNSADNSFTFTSCSSYTSNQASALLIIDSLKLPNFNKPTSSFSIAISTIGGNQVASVSSGITFTANPGSMQLVSTTPLIPVILAKTGITFSILPQHTIDTTTRVTIGMPSTYTLGTNCVIAGVSSNINPSSSCSFSGQTITINNLLSQTFIGGSTTPISFTVSQIQLPITNQTQSGLALAVLNQDSATSSFFTVDTFSGTIPMSFGSGTFLSAKVSPASVNAFAVTVYNIEFTPEHYIPQNGYIQIVFPSTISIPDSAFSQSSCTNFSSTFPSAPSCVVTVSNRTLTITNGFRTVTVQPAGTKYSLNIGGIQNPLSLGTTTSFSFSTYIGTGVLMDILTTGVTVTMTQTAIMQGVSVIMGSYVNAATTSYTFTITASVPITTQNYVIIQFPTQITIPTSDSMLGCRSPDSSLISGVSCALNNNQLSNSVRATLSFASGITQINILQTFRIVVNSITNPISTQSTSDFVLQITDRAFSPINRSPSGITISTNTPFTLQSASLRQNSTGASQPAQYNITIYPQHDIQVGGGIYIVYPSQVSTIGTVTATVISSYTRSTPTVTVTTSARQILITNAFQLLVPGSANASVLIMLTGFKNPSTSNVATSFEVKTFNQATVNGNAVYYYIDQVLSGLVLNSPCNYPCATCSSSNPSNCTSCYQTSALNKLQGGTCVSECATGLFYNSKLTPPSCQECSSPCLNCNVTATNCTSCGFPGFLYLFNNQCQNTCPSGYVTDNTNNKCAKCSSSCNTCELTTSTCTSCVNSTGFPFLYQSQCLKTCPTQLTIPSGNTCLNCDTMCKTCSGTTTNCTSCFSYMRFDPSINTCLAACTPDTQIYNSTTGQCLACSDNCQTCSGTVNTCTSCRNGLVLNIDNTCKAQCNSTDQIPISNVCKQCELPCSQCRGSLNHCTKCQGDYLLYNSTCVQYCPEKYEANNSTGQCILVGLICPAGYTVNEAGDGCIPNEFECPEGYEINNQKTACVPKPGSPVPFPFLIFSCILSLLVLGSWIKDKFFTKIYSTFVALLCFQEMLMYILMLAYSGYNQVWGAFVLSFIAVLMLMTANIVFYLYYKRDVLSDEVFKKWQRSFPRTSKWVPWLCLFVNFKIVRLFYCGFYGLESCLAQFENPTKNLFKPLKLVTYFQYVFIYAPIIVADIIVFAQVKWGFQLLVLAIETFMLVIAICIFTYLEFKDTSKLIIKSDEAYTRFKPKYFNGESMVMGGLIDVDESTLIRGKVVDDDYEIFLRKKAFVSILQQVQRNYANAITKGLDLGGKIDQVMTKFDEKRLKLRRAFSMEDIREEEWVVESPRDSAYLQSKSKGFTSGYNQEQEDEDDDLLKPRRYSYPLSPRSKDQVPDPQFKKNVKDIKQAQVVTKEQLTNNVYAECKAPNKNQEKNRRKTVSRRTQTYLRELLQLRVDDLHESDLEIVMEDDAEIDGEYARDLIDNLIEGLSESESNAGGIGKKRAKKKRKNLNTKRTKEIPEFELADIMGDFEIDDLGNFIILRGEKGELLDRKERRVNRRGYLIDRFGNIINKTGQIIFKAVELDSDDEIPAPFGFEKRKKNLLNLGQDGEFRVEGQLEKEIEDDEDLIDKELRMMRKAAKRRKRGEAGPGDGQILEEDEDNDDQESSVDSLMAESPGKYQLDQLGGNEDEIIANVTKKKIPVKRGQRGPGVRQRSNLRAEDDLSGPESKRKTGPLQNLPPRRIKRDDAKDLFPSLAIESSEQKKLYRIAEQIGSMANQIAEQTMKIKSNDERSLSPADKLEQLKQEHFKDLMSSQARGGQMSILSNAKLQLSDKKLPQRANVEKIYGNVGDVVNYEEQIMKEQYKGLRAQSPFASQLSTRMAFRPGESTINPDKRRLKGLESIYLQKFDKKAGLPNPKKVQPKAKFRNTLNQFVDDPEMLVDDGVDHAREREMSLQIADKLDRLQKQYMNNTATTTTNFKMHNNSASSMGFMQPTVGGAIMRKTGSMNGSLFNQDPSLDPVKKGNWVQKE